MSLVESRIERIRKSLDTEFLPTLLDIQDDSYRHAGHAGVTAGTKETHINITIVAPVFAGKSRVERHRLVQALLAEEFQNGLHALSIDARER